MQNVTENQPNELPDVFRVGIQLGILSQLYQTRMANLLEPLDMTYTQLALLSHLSHSPEPSTIGQLAGALEINQPGVTKVVQRLAQIGLVDVETGEGDRRRKLVELSESGAKKLGQALEMIGTDVTDWFESWTEGDLTSFRGQVEDLVGWLDNNRLAD